MARKGGYSRSTKDEWLKTNRTSYAEAITSAADMGQDLETWTVDAIAHHVYRCELLQAKELYEAACKHAAEKMQPSPLQSDFMPARPAPTISKLGQQTGSTERRPPRP